MTNRERLIKQIKRGVKSKNLKIEKLISLVEKVLNETDKKTDLGKKWATFLGFLKVERIQDTLDSGINCEDMQGYKHIYNGENIFEYIIKQLENGEDFDPNGAEFIPLICLIGDCNEKNDKEKDFTSFDLEFLKKVKKVMPNFYRENVGSSNKGGFRNYDISRVIGEYDDIDGNELDEQDEGKCVICVKDPAGLHLRPTQKLVSWIIEKTDSEEKIGAEAKGKKVNAKSILAVLGLCIQQGEKITIDLGNSSLAEEMRLTLEI